MSTKCLIWFYDYLYKNPSANDNISHPKQWPQIKQKELLKTFDIVLSKDNRVDLFKAEEVLILISPIKTSRQIPRRSLKISALTRYLVALTQDKPQTMRDSSLSQTGILTSQDNTVTWHNDITQHAN